MAVIYVGVVLKPKELSVVLSKPDVQRAGSDLTEGCRTLQIMSDRDRTVFADCSKTPECIVI